MSAWESPFVGRAAELEVVLSRFERGERLVSILGPPGMGKTRLARQALVRLHRAGVASAQVDAAACRDVSQMRAQLILSLGGLEDPPSSDARDGVQRALAGAGRAVVLVDNLEPIVETAAAELESWLAATSELQLLVTSRVRLRVAPEIVVDLGPLDDEAAEALFVERARRAAASFALRPEERPALRELVQRLDGLPLAIELAAARARTYRPAELLRRADARLELLGAIESSFDALSGPAQRALAHLSVLATPHDRDTVEAVIAAGSGAAPAPILEALVDASLVRASADEERDEVRFALYESIREFALRRLEQLGERAGAERAAADQLLGAAERAAAASTGADALDGLERLARTREDLTQACERELGRRPVVAARLALALHPLALARGPLDLHHALIARALAGLGAPDLALVARLHAACGYLCFLRGRLGEAREHLSTAFTLASDSGLPDVAADARSSLLLTTQWQGDHAEGGVELERDLSAFALFTLGLRALHHGDIESAAELLLRARATGLAAGQLRDAARALALYGLTRHEIGKLDAAASVFAQAASELERAGDAHFGVVLGLWRGLLTLERGDAEAAEGLLSAAASGFDRVGDPFFEAAARGYRGLALLFARRAVEAHDTLGLALPVLRDADDTYRLGVFLPLHAVACAELGDAASARRALEEARAVASRVVNPNIAVVGEVLRDLCERSLDERLDAPEATPRAVWRSQARISSDVRFAVSLHERRCRDAGAGAGSDAEAGAELHVATDGSWFRADGRRVDLRRRRSLALLLARLLQEHQRSPGAPLSTGELIAVGWPGERMLAAAGANRVHVAIATLRRLGLGQRLARTDGGYLIPGELRVDGRSPT